MALEKEITDYQAYLEMKNKCKYDTNVDQYPTTLLQEWDEMRLRLNPTARLSYAQELILQAAENNSEMVDEESKV